jgi:hypothetical protein
MTGGALIVSATQSLTVSLADDQPLKASVKLTTVIVPLV